MERLRVAKFSRRRYYRRRLRNARGIDGYNVAAFELTGKEAVKERWYADRVDSERNENKRNRHAAF